MVRRLLRPDDSVLARILRRRLRRRGVPGLVRGPVADQSQLLADFSRVIRGFFDELAAARRADGVVLLAFGEFGRRPAEDGSLGTDHGMAGAMFLAGPKVKAGLVGQTPRLGDLVDGDLKWSIDFRQIYATFLDRWLGLPAEAGFGRRLDHLPLLEA